MTAVVDVRLAGGILGSSPRLRAESLFWRAEVKGLAYGEDS